jgi:ATP-binding cassette subfamily F protein 3
MLQITNLTLRIAGRPLLERASVTVAEKSKVGLIGRNGTGKTTLFRAICGELAPDQGSIGLPKGWRIGSVAQEAPGGPQSLLEEVLRADPERTRLLHEAETETDAHALADIHTRLVDIGAHDAEARAARILHGLGFATAAQKRPCSEFSGGWRMRVALAGVLFSEPDLLLLDEPTNYLDLEGTLWLERYLARYPRTAIVISHDRDLLNKAVGTIVHFSERKLTAYAGGYDAFERQFRERQRLQAKLTAKQDAQRKHMEAFVERFRAKATKARQAQSRLKALARLKPIAKIADETMLPFRFANPAKAAAPPIIQMEAVSTGYDADRPVLADLDLRIDNDDRIALLGTNGNGKSTFAKLLAGDLAPFAGRLTRSNKLRIGYFAQHQAEKLQPGQSAYDHVRTHLEGVDETQVRARVAQMGLSTEKMNTPSKDLSGGEKARLLMGLATIDAPHLIILDEPTNHLDIDSREALVHALNDYDGAVIMISHDRHLIEACADRLWLVEDGTVKPFEGDLEDYRRLVLKGGGKANGSDEAAAPASAKAQRRAAAAMREAAAPIRKKIKECERLMADLTKRIEAIDTRLSDTDLYVRDPDEAARLARLRARRAEKLGEAEEIWLKLTAMTEKLEATV